MSSAMNIAVIVVNWNSGSWLKKCLAALEAQTRPPHRILVVDNASTDGSADCLAGVGGVETVALEKNTGFAAANNLAVRMTEDCDWVALLNPDAFPRTDWLENLTRAAGQNPEYDFFGCRMTGHPDETRLDGTGDVYHVSGLAWRRDHGRPTGEREREAEEIFSPCAAAAIYRRSVFMDAGGFDENFFTYFEDVDLAFRLRLRGYRCLYVPTAVVAHVGSASSGKQSDFSIYHGHRNLVWAYFKNMPRDLLWLYLPQHLLANLAALIWFTGRGQGGMICRAKWDAVRGLPRVWKERKRIQEQVRIRPRDLKTVMARGWFRPYFKNLVKE